MIPIRFSNRSRPGVISVLVASRHRIEMLRTSVASLLERAARPDDVEILVAYDPDDPDTASAVPGARVWCAPERYGYAEGARYYARLLDMSYGEWLLPCWGDDGRMSTDDWDDVVRAQPNLSVLHVRGGDQYGNNCFPVVGRTVFEVLGRFCHLPAIDTWYDDVGKAAGIWRDPGIEVWQDRYDITGNNHDQVYTEGRSGYRSGEYYAAKGRALRAQDAARLIEWRDRVGQR